MTNKIQLVLATAQLSYFLSKANFSSLKNAPKFVNSLIFLSIIPFSNAL